MRILPRHRIADRVGIGVVGCGTAFKRVYGPLIESLRCHGMVEVVAACDENEREHEFVHERFGDALWTTHFEDLVTSNRVDVVLILTPPQTHGVIARAALEAGKHVLVEKPMAVSLVEAEELVALAKRSTGYLVCAPFVILSPTYRRIWQATRQGEVGKILSARARSVSLEPLWSEWFYRRGAGALFDLGVYNITSLTGLLGPSRRVTAMAGVAVPSREIRGAVILVEAEDTAQVVIDFGESVYAAVTTGFGMKQDRSPAIELYGTLGTIQMLGQDWAPQGWEMWKRDAQPWFSYPESDPKWHYADGLNHLIQCVRAQRPPVVTPEHSFHVLEIMIRAQESSRDGEAKAVESTFEFPSLRDAES